MNGKELSRAWRISVCRSATPTSGAWFCFCVLFTQVAEVHANKRYVGLSTTNQQLEHKLLASTREIALLQRSLQEQRDATAEAQDRAVAVEADIRALEREKAVRLRLSWV